MKVISNAVLPTGVAIVSRNADGWFEVSFKQALPDASKSTFAARTSSVSRYGRFATKQQAQSYFTRKFGVEPKPVQKQAPKKASASKKQAQFVVTVPQEVEVQATPVAKATPQKKLQYTDMSTSHLQEKPVLKQKVSQAGKGFAPTAVKATKSSTPATKPAASKVSIQPYVKGATGTIAYLVSLLQQGVSKEDMLNAGYDKAMIGKAAKKVQ